MPGSARLGGLDTRTAAELRAWLDSAEGRTARGLAVWSATAAADRAAESAAAVDALRAEVRAEVGRERWRRAAGLPSPDSATAPSPSGGGAAASVLGTDASLTAPVARPDGLDVSGHGGDDRTHNRGNQSHPARGGE